MEKFGPGTHLSAPGWHSSISQCEETAAFLLWGVKRQVRGRRTEPLSAVRLYLQGDSGITACQVEKEAKVAQVDTEKAH